MSRSSEVDDLLPLKYYSEEPSNPKMEHEI